MLCLRPHGCAPLFMTPRSAQQAGEGQPPRCSSHQNPHKRQGGAGLPLLMSSKSAQQAGRGRHPAVLDILNPRNRQGRGRAPWLEGAASGKEKGCSLDRRAGLSRIFPFSGANRFAAATSIAIPPSRGFYPHTPLFSTSFFGPFSFCFIKYHFLKLFVFLFLTCCYYESKKPPITPPSGSPLFDPP